MEKKGRAEEDRKGTMMPTPSEGEETRRKGKGEERKAIGIER